MAGLGVLYLALEYLLLPNPRRLAKENPEVTSLMRIRSREAMREGRSPERVHVWVPLSAISRHLRHAVTVAEDDKFYDHPGYDADQIRRSLEINWKARRIARGGSTITQQLARNLYLSPSRNPLRKAKELVIALRLEKSLTKDRILEIYLNVIEWGDGIYGAEAASRTYFGKGAARLLPEEAATLAAIIPNPRARDPREGKSIVMKRKRLILRLMRKRGYLTYQELADALSRPVVTKRKPRATSPQKERGKKQACITPRTRHALPVAEA